MSHFNRLFLMFHFLWQKLQFIWKKKFGEEVDEDFMYVVSVERVLHIENFGEVCGAFVGGTL